MRSMTPFQTEKREDSCHSGFTRWTFFAIASLITLLAYTSPAASEEKKMRAPITPIVEPKSGTYFDFLDEVGSSGFGEYSLAFLRKRDASGSRTAPIAHMNLDDLAHWHVIAYESYESVLLQMKFAHEIYQKPQLPPEVARRIQHRVLYPDKSSEMVSYTEALLLYNGMLQLLDVELSSQESRHNLAGNYDAQVSGECPFAAGTVLFEQRDHFVEGIRGNQLLLVGVLGQTRAWFVSKEQRYGTVTIESGLFGKSLRIDAPDAPSELYVGEIRGEGIDLSGTVRSNCDIALRRAGS